MTRAWPRPPAAARRARDGPGRRKRAALARPLLALALALGAGHSLAQHFHYVEPGVAACPPPPGASAAPKGVALGKAVPGRIQVDCGFDQGSYTLSLNSTDPAAVFVPRTFLVNFGRLVGSGAFAVTFATAGVQRVTVAITSNMGSPAVRGHFAAATDEFRVEGR